MSSSQKIGRWNRFEIAFAQENRPQKSLFSTPERPAPNQLRGLRKIDKKTRSNERAADEPETSEKEAFPESASPRRGRSASDSPSLWEEARRQKEKAAKKATQKRDKRR